MNDHPIDPDLTVSIRTDAFNIINHSRRPKRTVNFKTFHPDIFIQNVKKYSRRGPGKVRRLDPYPGPLDTGVPL